MRYLRYGDTGPDVELLQLGLRRAGFSPGKIDGIFGPATRSALVAFQLANGLVPDGIAGSLTMGRLRDYLVGYTTHRISRNDTFFALSKKYGTSVDAIMAANPNLRPNNLQFGEKVIIPLGFMVTPTDISYTYYLTSLVVEGLAARYPFLRTGTIGRSVMGRELYYIALGTGEDRVFFNASHHANEWITTPLVLKFVEELCMSYAFSTRICDAEARVLLSAARLVVVPLVNPDGVDLVNGALSADDPYFIGARAIADSFAQIPFPSGWKANILGTDLNLNYPAQWEEAKRIKYAQGYDRPAPRDFVGREPLSAPESRAVHDFSIQQDFSLTLSYHTQGGEIYWKFQDYEVEGALATAQRMANASGYRVADVPYNSSFAGYKDWFIETYMRRGFTIEAGRGENPLPISDFNEIYSENVCLMKVALDSF